MSPRGGGATTFLPKPTARAPQLEPLTPVAATDAQRRTTHMAASLLLGYPDAEVRAAVPVVRDAVPGLPAPVAERLTRFLDVLATTDPHELEALYVQTFDLKRKCSMYLSYFATGDTRKRGMALVRFVQAYRAAGWEVDGDELPDHLPTVLELSARSTGDDEARIAAGLLGTHREGIEVLRSALAAMRSPWTDVVEAVCLTLPALDARTHARFVELVTAGPRPRWSA
ncbi:nitrate reductase delta subunit [Paraoerskovia sediminicola]|uniref:Nitrate reductase delta subunit n=1 Tax=Paraoerskovia sediminicola TaxID=1138587 RepID=A0ABM8G309_9CELL|nr:nitrate reductase molybdenum cofactor assembly chaperone [Paraoerskovia sediminicola]BDZ42391.1 nitrate reductase delta subunit [Paraoerskovia sediminicola]